MSSQFDIFILKLAIIAGIADFRNHLRSKAIMIKDIFENILTISIYAKLSQTYPHCPGL
jgi:hypothetical protein